MLRSFRLIRRDPLEFLRRTWVEFGDIAQFPIPRPGTYLVTDPVAVRDILVTHWRDFSKRTLQYDNLALVTGMGLLTADDPPWRDHRRVVQPAFHHDALSGIAEHVGDATRTLLARWSCLPPGAEVDIDEAMMQLSLEVVAAALFGAHWELEAPALTTATVVALDEVVARARNPLKLPVGWQTPGSRRLRQATAALDDAVDQVLAQRERIPNDGSRPLDLVDLLLNSSQLAHVRLSRREIRDELVTFLVAGHETVASALTWAWYLLGRNPEASERLQREVSQVLDGRAPQFEDLAKLPWTRAIVEETLRLYPPAWVISRKSLIGHKFANCEVPAGSLVIISPGLVHRHPGIWDRPDEFDPQRFVGAQSSNRPGYLPFGIGPRMCIGMQMSLMECTLVLAAVAARFELRAPGSQVVNARPSVTLRPDGGLVMTVHPR